jgi:predicted MFS family arabinose efflux permease
MEKPVLYDAEGHMAPGSVVSSTGPHSKGLAMNRKLYWTLGVGLVGLLLATKGTHWFLGTYFRDAESLTLGLLAGGIIGFLLGCIVEKTTDERRRRAKVVYWLFAMAVFGSYLGFGKAVPTHTTLMVMAWTLGIGLVVGLLQYFLQSKETIR